MVATARSGGDADDAPNAMEWGEGTRLHAYVKGLTTGASLRDLETWARDAWTDRRTAGEPEIDTLARTRIQQLRAGIGRPPRLEQLQALNEGVSLHRHGRRNALDQTEMRRVYADALRSRPSLTNAASAPHFATVMNDWGKATQPSGQGISGSVCVAHLNATPPPCYALVFDWRFQYELKELQEQNILRRDGPFHKHTTATPTSFRVWGEVARHSGVRTFLGVEATRWGAVSVYFKEYSIPRDSDHVVAGWLPRSLQMALVIHQLLNAEGEATVALILNEPWLAGIGEAPKPLDPETRRRGSQKHDQSVSLEPDSHRSYQYSVRLLGALEGRSPDYGRAWSVAIQQMPEVRTTWLGLDARADRWDLEGAIARDRP